MLNLPSCDLRALAEDRMANVVRDPKIYPDAILPDLSKPDSPVKFTPCDGCHSVNYNIQTKTQRTRPAALPIEHHEPGA